MTPPLKTQIFPVLALFLLLSVFLSMGLGDTPGASARGGEAYLHEERGIDQGLADLLDQIPSLLRRARVPGLSLAVIRGGEIMWSGGFGIRDSEVGDSVDASTLFEAASLSKPLCAYAALRMVDRGDLDLDRPLVDYLGAEGLRVFLGDDFQDRRIRLITARMVLTHTSGLPNWRRSEPLRILNDPGQSFSYSGEGFIFLQTVLEEICQCTYAELMDAEVLNPLGMGNSDFRWATEYESRVASRHDERGQVVGRALPTRVHAAGTLLTTAEDYGRFLIAVMTGAGLTPESQIEMTRVQFRFPGRNESTISWGLGVGVDGPPGAVTVWHHGDNRTTMAFVLGLPETGDGVVYFANGQNGLGFLEEIVGGALGSSDPVRSFRSWTNYPRIR